MKELEKILNERYIEVMRAALGHYLDHLIGHPDPQATKDAEMLLDSLEKLPEVINKLNSSLMGKAFRFFAKD